jgi:hypothetical protein
MACNPLNHRVVCDQCRAEGPTLERMADGTEGHEWANAWNHRQHWLMDVCPRCKADWDILVCAQRLEPGDIPE